MAYYGIYSAGVALTASTDADIIRYSFRSANALTANTVYGLEGDDIISVGAQGQTTTARSTFTGVAGAANLTGSQLSATVFGSAGLPVGTTATLIGTGHATGALYFASIQATGVVTSQQGLQTLASTQLWGNQGNDIIALGTKLVALTSSTLGGGAGNDLIGTLQYLTSDAPSVSNFSAAVKFEKAFIEGGGNDDTIQLFGTGVDFDISASTIQGGAQNDIVQIGMNGTAVSSFFAGGGGDDSLVLQHSSVVTANSIVGGGGNDTISFVSNSDVAKNTFFLDTTDLTTTTYDGNDVFTGRISAAFEFSANSIYGGAGNDIISIGTEDAAEESFTANLIDLGDGNDTFTSNTAHLKNVTILGGAGNDSVVILSSVLASTLNLGAGNDFVQLDDPLLAGASATTIIGGLGADLFSAVDDGNVLQAARFTYVTATDSTLSSMDTIAIGGGSNTRFQFNYSPGSVVVANFTTSSPGGTAIATATNGVVTFLNDAPSDLTSRVAFLDTEITTNGQAVIFNNNLNNRAYLFIQAGSSDLLVQMGTAGTVSGATLAVAAGAKSFSATIL